MDRIKHLLIIVSIVFTISMTAQDNKNLTTTSIERVFVHTNSASFITGETLLCKVYCLNAADNTRSLVSKIAYIELIDNTRKSVFRQKLYLENGTAQGDFFIPTTLKTGNYKLLAYTKWMLNQPGNLFESDLTIINPYQPLDKNNLAKIDTPKIENTIEPVSNHTDLVIQTDKKTYALREKVNLKIKSSGQITKGNYSISVRKTDNLPMKNPLSAAAFNKMPNNRQSAGSIIFLPELRGELLSGFITSKTQKDLHHKTVALSIPGKSFALKIAETDRTGKFTFILDRNPGLAEVTIQIVDSDRDNYILQLNENKGADPTAITVLPEFSFGQELKSTIEERSVATQIENAYYSKKKDSIVADLPTQPFYYPIEKVYVLDDYTRFPSIKETITEVVTELYYTKKDNKYHINLRNYATNNEGYGTPLLLVDGLLIQDANELFDYNPENIYKISLVNQPYIFGPKTFSGVVNITTKNYDYQSRLSGDFLKKVSVQRPANRKQYYKPEYKGNENARIPDYRHQILWQPEVKVDAAESNLTFFTSDVAGKFEIVLEGFTENGQPVSIRDFIEVK